MALKIGDTYTYRTSFKQEDVETFARITGDNNPIHLDSDFASKTPFGRPIVHGFFAAAVFSKVFGTEMLPQGTIYKYQDMKFIAPVFVDTPYVAFFEVLEIDLKKNSGLVSCILKNEITDQPVIIGNAKLKNSAAFI